MSATDDEELERCSKRIGTTVRGKWHLDALLGIGGMAAVYAATHKMGRRDAIKILHAHVAGSKELRARFEQEARAISALNHPGVVKVLDIDATEDGKPFMVMELLSGRTLGELHAELAPRDVLVHMERVLDVLTAAHAQGIIHRDIKPDNLFLTTDGRLLVLDFGIARMKASGEVRTRLGAMLGTTSFMAPEQIQGRDVDGRADLFAVGATMFRLLSKQRIHDAETDAELVIKMGTTPAPSLRTVAPNIAPEVAAIVDRALAFDREQRYQDASSMRADVRAVLGLGSTDVAAPPPPSSFAGASTMAAPVVAIPPAAPSSPTATQLAPASGHVVSARTATVTMASEPDAAAPRSKRPLLIAVAAAVALAISSMLWIGWTFLTPEPSKASTKSDDEETRADPDEESTDEETLEVAPSAGGVTPLPASAGPHPAPPTKPKPPAAGKKPNGKKPKKPKD